MTINKSLIDTFHKVQQGMMANNLNSCWPPMIKPSSCKPEPPDGPPAPDQEEMDKLASKLTEAVLQLRAGDMEGARKTLTDADQLCDVRISAGTIQHLDHYADALRYGMGVHQHIYRPSDSGASATEILMRQQEAERRMALLQEQMMANVNSTLCPPRIVSDNTADPTAPPPIELGVCNGTTKNR